MNLYRQAFRTPHSIHTYAQLETDRHIVYLLNFIIKWYSLPLLNSTSVYSKLMPFRFLNFDKESWIHIADFDKHY